MDVLGQDHVRFRLGAQPGWREIERAHQAARTQDLQRLSTKRKLAAAAALKSAQEKETSVFGSLKRGLEGKMFKRIVAGALKDAGEGKYGAVPKALYDFLDRHAVALGGILGLVYAAAWGVGQLLPEHASLARAVDSDLLVAMAILTGAGIPVQLHASQPPTR